MIGTFTRSISRSSIRPAPSYVTTSSLVAMNAQKSASVSQSLQTTQTQAAANRFISTLNDFSILRSVDIITIDSDAPPLVRFAVKQQLFGISSTGVLRIGRR